MARIVRPKIHTKLQSVNPEVLRSFKRLGVGGKTLL